MQDLPFESSELIPDGSQSSPGLRGSQPAGFDTTLEITAVCSNKENYGIDASTMPACKIDMRGVGRGTTDWSKNSMERRGKRLKEVLGGWDPQEFVEQPEATRLRQLRSVLTKPGWLWMLSDEVDDDMLPGIVLLCGLIDETIAIQQEAWQVYFGDNSFFVEYRYICELLGSAGNGLGPGKNWIRSLNIIISVYGDCRQDPEVLKRI